MILLAKSKIKDPRHLFGAYLKLWLAADESPKLFNGNKVSKWNDISGNNYDAAQSTDINQPVFDPCGINGMPALLFNGSTTSINNSTLPVLNNPVSCYTVARAGSSANSQIIINGGVTVSANQSIYVNPSGLLRVYGGTVLSPSSVYTNKISILGYSINNTANDTGFSQIDGKITGDAGNNKFGNVNGYIVGDSVTAGTGVFNGHIAEIILVNRSLEPVENFSIINYLSHKYKISILKGI